MEERIKRLEYVVATIIQILDTPRGMFNMETIELLRTFRDEIFKIGAQK